jgi:hypothetical protein
LRDVFLRDAEAVLDRRHALLDERARRGLVELIDRGVERVSVQPPKEIAAGQRNLRSLVEAIIDDARSHQVAGERGVTEVTETNVVAVQNRLCPVFPFC